MHTHHYITTRTAHISQWHLQLHLISLSQVSSPAVQLFPFFQGKTEAWHLLLLSGDSGMCVFMCADVCIHLSISVLLLHLPRLGGLCMLFPRKKLLMPFWPSLKWRQSHVQFLAWHIAILMIPWPREETHPRDICIFITWRTLLLECQISIICLQEYQTAIISSKLFLKSCLRFAVFP